MPNSIVKVGSGLQGEYRCVLYDNEEDMNVIHDTGWHDNVITNLGLDLYGSDANWEQYFYIGNGTTPVDFTDTAMEGFLAQSTTPGNGDQVQTVPISPDWTSAQTKSKRFIAGVGTGTITELGVGSSTDGTELFCHQLVAPIVKAAINVLDVIWRLTVWPDLTTTAGSVTIDGVVYDTLIRRSNADDFINPWDNLGTLSSWYVTESDLGADVITTPDIPAYGGSAGVFEPYVASNRWIDIIASEDLQSWNAPLGIRSIVWTTRQGQWQCQFNSNPGGLRIPKTDEKIMTMTFRISWDRH